MVSSRERVLTRKYSLLAASGVVPLALVIVVLIGFQLGAERARLLEELEEQAVEHDILLGSILKTVHDYVQTLAAWGEIHGGETPDPDQRVVPGRAGEAGALVIVGSAAADRPGAAADQQLALDLARHMRLAHRTMPYLRRSHLFSAAGDLVALAPFVDGQTLGGGLRAGSDDEVIARLAAAHLTLDEAGSPTRGWGAAHEDPAGAGWLTTYNVPIEVAGEPRGVVGTAVLLDFLTGFVRAFDYPAGRLWLVNDQLQVLAASDRQIIGSRGLSRLGEVLPPDLAAVDPATLLAPSRAFRSFGANHVLAQRVGATSWTLLFVLSSAELNAVVLPRMIPYGIILAALILTIGFAHLLRQRLIVRPALAFADFIKAETGDERTSPPRLPALWQPLVAAVAEAFGAKRSALDQIQDSEALKSAIIASSFDALIAIDTEDRVVEFNPAAEQTFGIARAQALGRPLAELIVPPALRDAHLAGLSRYLATGERKMLGRRLEYEAMRADGTLVPIEIAVTEVRQADRRLFTAYIRDITGRRAMEQALRASERHFRSIADAHPVALNITRLDDGIILHASQAFAELYRLPVEAIVGHTTLRFYGEPRDRARLLAALDRDGAVDRFEFEGRRADGTTFPAALTSRLIDFQGARCVISGVLDLTAQKAAETEIARQREALHQSEKLNALGSLLANVAHELNNPLSVVVGHATLMRDLAADPAIGERAQKVLAAAERCARIVKTFLAMARQKAPAHARVDLNQVIEGALEVAGYGLEIDEVEVGRVLAPDLPPIAGDADQLTLVLMNLIVNAQHALRTRPRPRRLEISSRQVGNQVAIELADNGPGIEAAIVERVFEPFFTTKPQGAGTGIGLSVCHGIVTAHGGEITLGCTLEGGALFTLHLPVAGADVALPLPPKTEPAGVEGRILVVEDEVEIAQMLAEVLGRDRHQVILAGSGREALARLETDDVDLILSDIRMPDLDGPGLYRELQARTPDLAGRMVFVTGDVLTPDTVGFLADTGLPVLEKPIDPHDLRQKIRRYLAEADRPEGLRGIRSTAAGGH